MVLCLQHYKKTDMLIGSDLSDPAEPEKFESEGRSTSYELRFFVKLKLDVSFASLETAV